MRTTPWSNITVISDEAANDSDKTLIVPANRQWLLHAVAVRLVSDGTVGNRQLDLLVTDAADNFLLKLQAGAVQAASLTRDYFFAPGHPQETSFVNGLMLRALPSGVIVQEGFKVRIYDSAAIAAAADDLTVRLLVEERLK